MNRTVILISGEGGSEQSYVIISYLAMLIRRSSTNLSLVVPLVLPLRRVETYLDLRLQRFDT